MASPEGFLRIVQGLSDFVKGAKSGADDTVELIQRALGGQGITPQQAREARQAIEALRPSRAAQPIEGTQLRLGLTQPGRGAQVYSPAKSSTPAAADVIRAERGALPAESSAARMRGLASEAEQAGLMGRVDPEILMRLQQSGASPSFLQEAARQARLSQVPRTTTMQGPARLTGTAAPEPQFNVARMSDELMTLRGADPGTFRAIAELSAPLAQKSGASILEVVEAVTGPNGNKVINFIEAGNDLPTAVRLAQGGPMVPTRGSAMTTMADPGALTRSPRGGIVDQSVEDVSVHVLDPEMLSAAVPGVQRGNFGILRNVPPEVLAGLGLTAGGLAAAGLGRMAGGGDRSQQGSPTADLTQGTTMQPPGVPPIDPSTPPPSVPGAVPPSLTGGMPPAGPVVIPPAVAGVDPTLPAPIVTNGDRDSMRREQIAQADPRAAVIDRMMEPMSPERYKNIADYYRDRAAYSAQPDVKRELIKYAGGTNTSPEMALGLEQWAQKFPGLAYELQRRALANPAANQQSPESVTTPTVGTQMGSDNTFANPVGNAEAAAATIDGTQGAYDLKNATDMIPQARLQRIQSLVENVRLGR